jgi:hypothetical protein
MALLNNVPGTDLSDDPKKPMVIGRAWTSFFEAVFNLLFAMTQSGTTAQRPTTFLWFGRRFYDTTLGKPVYVASVGPTVWKDAAGNTV